jgi:IS5 family transposase
VALAVDERGMVVTHAEYTDNRHDSTTLADSLSGWEEATGRLPEKLAADRGYGTQDKNTPPGLSRIAKVAIPKKGKTWGPLEYTRWFKKLVASRAGIEAVIAHLKTDHGMGRCRYKGFSGDRMNVSWAVLAWNTKKWAAQTTG